MTDPTQPQAGPSRTSTGPRKPRNARPKIHKLQPPLPPKTPTSNPATTNGHLPTLPIKTIQGAKTRRTDGTRDGYGREVVFVTRNVGLGALMGRCRSLVMDEGYTCLTLHALAAAIPHALLLLHALMDVLPYPKGDKGMWYEISTGSVECVDEVTTGANGAASKGAGKRKKRKVEKADVDLVNGETRQDGMASAASEDINDEREVELGAAEMGNAFGDIGGIEEEEPMRQTRLKSSIQIQLHIGPKRPPPTSTKAHDSTIKRIKGPPTILKRNRAGKRKREAARREKNGKEGEGRKGGSGVGSVIGLAGGAEEEMMNMV